MLTLVGIVGVDLLASFCSPREMNDTNWKSVDGFVGYYEVSSRGDVRSLLNQARNKTRIHALSPKRVAQGYLGVTLCGANGFRKQVLIHRLVAGAFIPNPGGLPQVNHKNGKQGDNRVENLEWMTSQQNVRHSIISGTWHKTGTGVMSIAQVQEIRSELAKGLNCRQVGLKFGVSRGAIDCIKRGVTWKFV